MSGMLFLPFAWGLHVLATLAFVAGMILLFIWAFKRMNEADLKKWGWILVAVGIFLSIISFGIGGKVHMKVKDGKMLGTHSMHEMNDSGDGMGMSMAGMTESLKGKTGDAFDKEFLEQMIIHHEGAVEMARMAQSSAKHAEIKRLAGDIITAQQNEIDEMQAWMEEWGYKQ